MKTTGIIKVLMWFPQVAAAVVQGVTNKYVVFYHRQTCTCPHNSKGHHRCKHIGLVLEELISGLVQCECCKAYWPTPQMRQSSQEHPICQECHAGLATGLTIECDDCGFVKPADAYGDPGHTAGGSCFGFDIDTCICAACGQRSYDELQEDLGREACREVQEDRLVARLEAHVCYGKSLGQLTPADRDELVEWAMWPEDPQGERAELEALSDHELARAAYRAMASRYL